jgi:hypothetical protein
VGLEQQEEIPVPNHSFVTFIPKAIIPAIALAGLTSVALLHTTAPAAAAVMNSCQLRHSYCSERCIMKYKENGAIDGCISRTCDHQFKSCSQASGDTRGPHDHGGAPGRGGGGRGLTGSTPKVGPPAGGILESGAVLGTSAPAATGSPVGGGRPAAAPSAPVIIR